MFSGKAHLSDTKGGLWGHLIHDTLTDTNLLLIHLHQPPKGPLGLLKLRDREVPLQDGAALLLQYRGEELPEGPHSRYPQSLPSRPHPQQDAQPD